MKVWAVLPIKVLMRLSWHKPCKRLKHQTKCYWTWFALDVKQLSLSPISPIGKRVAILDSEEKCRFPTHYLICGTTLQIFICVRFVILKPFAMQMGLKLLIDLLSTATSKVI